MDSKLKDFTKKALEVGNGVLKLLPPWVPRSFLTPGRRLKLHPDDLYILGAERGGMDERWLASTTKAYNGPLTPEDEGLSYVVLAEQKYTLKDIIECCGEKIIGGDMMEKYVEAVHKVVDNIDELKE